jgi:molybdenum-dependent DNA-binding transcriptional regulator ModE
MDHAEYDRATGQIAKAAIIEAFGSVQGGAKASGIPYASLDRKLKGITSFTTRELRLLAGVTKRRVRDLLPRETGRVR